MNNGNARHFNNVISVNFFGNAFYHPGMVSFDMKVHSLQLSNHSYNRETGLYFTSLLNHCFDGRYSYGNQLSSSKLKKENFQLDIPMYKDGTIAFDYIEAYIKELEAERIKELEAYLVATGLNDYVLTDEEEKVLADFKNNDVSWQDYKLDDLFDHIVQGRRLKKDDQISGLLPFVMSGTTNNGIANFVSNDIRKFPENSLTIDIFGSAFYRDYEYGMGDDTGAYWNENNVVSKKVMLFYTASINRAFLGKYDYGYKLRSTRSKNLTIKVPCDLLNGYPDYKKMDSYVRAIEKLVIKGVVKWKDKQIEVTREVVDSE